MEANKNRILWIDAAKFAGIFAIVLGHTLRGGDVQHYLYSFHVALFFILSGITFKTTSHKSFFDFAKKRFYSIMIPYFAFSAISLAIFLVLGSFAEGILDTGTANSGLWSELFNITVWGYSVSNRPLWFLPCLFVLSLLAFPIIRFVETEKKNKFAVIFTAITLSVLFLVFSNIFEGLNKLPWKLACAVSMLSFFLLGYLCKNMHKKIENTKHKWILPIIVILLVIGFALGMKNEAIEYMENEYRNIPLFFASSLATIAAICMLCIKLPTPRFIAYIGENTLPILLMHKFPILFFQTIFPLTKELLMKSDALTGIIVSAISIAMCLIANWIILKIAPALVGAKAKK